MLARLNAQIPIEVAYLSSDGTKLLLQGAPGASRAEVLSASTESLAESKLRPQPLSSPDAGEAWAAREGEAWLAEADLWKLSWREAETFADRVLAVLIEEQGEPARGLRPLLVESFFEGVRPSDGSGPAPTRWEQGASLEVRRAALIEEARRLLSAAQAEEVAVLLSDGERIREILRPR